MPTQSLFSHTACSSRLPVPAFNSQRYCPTIKINTFPLFRLYHILEQFHVRAFSSIPPRCLHCARHRITPFVPLSSYRQREGRISVSQCNFRYRKFPPRIIDPLGENRRLRAIL